MKMLGAFNGCILREKEALIEILHSWLTAPHQSANLLQSALWKLMADCSPRVFTKPKNSMH